jgi:RluA family pseudouridine synthase
MDMYKLTVGDNEVKLSTLEFLQRHISAASRSYLRQLLKKGKIVSAGAPLTETSVLQAGMEIELPQSGRLCELLSGRKADGSQPVVILYESREILIVDKPAGLAVHSSVGHEQQNLTDQVIDLLTERGSSFSCAPVHRLDIDTSGPVLYGKGKKACSVFGKMFMQHEVEKSYLALVQGRTGGSGMLCSMLSSKGTEKEATTSFRALQRNDDMSLLELTLYTGRQHQIRRQLAELGHPLFGDRRYGGACPTELARMFLHCRRLAFVDPFSAATIEIESPLPAELKDFLANNSDFCVQ